MYRQIDFIISDIDAVVVQIVHHRNHGCSIYSITEAPGPDLAINVSKKVFIDDFTWKCRLILGEDFFKKRPNGLKIVTLLPDLKDQVFILKHFKFFFLPFFFEGFVQ